MVESDNPADKLLTAAGAQVRDDLLWSCCPYGMRRAEKSCVKLSLLANDATQASESNFNFFRDGHRLTTAQFSSDESPRWNQTRRLLTCIFAKEQTLTLVEHQPGR
jgi:hypothetical protein